MRKPWPQRTRKSSAVRAGFRHQETAQPPWSRPCKAAIRGEKGFTASEYPGVAVFIAPTRSAASGPHLPKARPCFRGRAFPVPGQGLHAPFTLPRQCRENTATAPGRLRAPDRIAQQIERVASEYPRRRGVHSPHPSRGVGTHLPKARPLPGGRVFPFWRCCRPAVYHAPTLPRNERRAARAVPSRRHWRRRHLCHRN